MSETAYDSVPYPGHAHAHTHPNRIAAIAQLFGLNAPAVATARILEIACGDGANLIPIAYSLPQAQCVGFDLAATAVAQAQERIERLGLNNCRITVADLASVGKSFGEFDYVIAHGLYSWIPARLRDALMKLIADVLSPPGVAFVSYNIYPGWHVGRMVRDMMRFHTREIAGADEKIEQARALLRFLAAAQDNTDDVRRVLAAECERMAKHTPGHMFHDDLAEVNDPVYLHEFVAHARRFGLDFVAEADFATMSGAELPEATREKLEELRGDPVQHGQYFDFVTCRRFRQTLLCRAGSSVATSPVQGVIRKLVFASAARADAEPVDLGAGVEVQFRWGKRSSLKTDHPLAKMVFLTLGEEWPEAVSFDDLLAKATRWAPIESGDDSAAALERILLAGFGLRMVDVASERWRSVSMRSERPKASAVARLESESRVFVTSPMHRAVSVDDALARRVLQLCNGHRAVPDILSALSREDYSAKPADLTAELQRLALLGLFDG